MRCQTRVSVSDVRGILDLGQILSSLSVGHQFVVLHNSRVLTGRSNPFFWGSHFILSSDYFESKSNSLFCPQSLFGAPSNNYLFSHGPFCLCCYLVHSPTHHMWVNWVHSVMIWSLSQISTYIPPLGAPGDSPKFWVSPPHLPCISPPMAVNCWQYDLVHLFWSGRTSAI